jgi:superfamily I DNA/RNA helicase
VKLTDQQEAIIGAFRAGDSLAVCARAGTGKTSTIEAAYRAAERPGLYVAFNKKNAVEAAERMPSCVTSKTLNALGHKAWWQFTRKKLEIDTDKLWKLWRQSALAKDFGLDETKEIIALTRAARVLGVKPGFGPVGEASADDWLDAADFAEIDEPEGLFKAARELLKASCKAAFEGQMDFDDQIYMPVLFGAPFDRHALVTVDEAQDLSGLQHRMVQKMLAPKGQLVIVGDPAQAIYGFRGASQNSFDELVERFALPTLPLSRSFRCPRAVIHEAQKYVPDIEAASDRLGRVSTGVLTPSPGWTLLSRTNAPLVSHALRAIRRGQPINYLGRDFTSGLLALHKKAPGPNALAEWLVAQKAKSRKSKWASLEDRYATMMVLHSESGDIPAKIRSLMSAAKSGPAITLSTIHKSKGLEWPKVCYLDYAKEWSGAQEDNIKYVGVTRAQEELLLESSEV